MFESIQISLGTVLLLVILYAFYSYRAKQTGFSNGLYKFLIVLHTLVMVLEMIIKINTYDVNNYDNYNIILCKINWDFAMLWLLLLAGYLMNIGKKVHYSNLFDYFRKEKVFRIVLFIFFILSIILFTLPLEFKAAIGDKYGYATGPAVFFVYGIGLFVSGIGLILLIKNRKKITKTLMLPLIISTIHAIVFVPLQIKHHEVLFITSTFAVTLYIIYFTAENPDLFVIEKLNEEKDRAEKSNMAKSDFLSNMSHEIRTPMNAIIGFSENLLEQDTINIEESKKDIKHIYSAGTNLLEIINNILDISKIETGSEVLEERDYSIGSVILELSSIIEARINTEKVKFIIDVDENTPALLYGDKVKVFQVLLNILSNSVKYTEYGNITLKLTPKVENDRVLLRFVISDTGYGIKQEDYDKLFEKFSRLDNATKNEIEGTGLGLAITKKLINLLNGNIWFKSEYGVGTTFYVDIIQKVKDKSKLGKIHEAKIEGNNISYIDCSSYRALIVDDNKLNIKVAEKVLTPYKFKIESVTSGQDCINKIKIGEEYDIIFLDHMMPGLDGIETVHILKSLKDYKIPPIVALTANAITGMREMYLKEGFDAYLSKPINTSDLNKIIESYFNKDREV